MNALDMDFNGMKFDIIINEALLTMCKDKQLFLNSYKKHLKPNGILLTHDICIEDCEKDRDYSSELKNIINLKPFPLSKEKWDESFINSNFHIIDHKKINFSLVSFKGLIRDEGLFNMIRIFINSRKKENKQDFKNMRKYFLKNKNNLKAICYITRSM